VFDALLFDMDGVVIDTHQAVTAFWDALAHQHDVRLTPDLYDQYIYGSPAIYTFDHVFPMLADDEREQVLQNLVDSETGQTYVEIAGVTALLHALKQQGIPTALVTSGQRWKVDAVLNQLGLRGQFTVEVTAGDIRQGKPHPECYLLAVEKLGRKPERCIVFEDSINGMKAGVAAGAFGIGIRPAHMAASLLEVGAQHVVADFSQARVEAAALTLGNGYTLALG
jgi:sugar-phosphatase